jgi:hypothetical protein
LGLVSRISLSFEKTVESPHSRLVLVIGGRSKSLIIYKITRFSLRNKKKSFAPKPRCGRNLQVSIYVLQFNFRGDYLFSLMNYRSLSTCHHELTHRPKESMQLQFLYLYPHFVNLNGQPITCSLTLFSPMFALNLGC